MKQYRTVDLFKFICALLIIVLHTAPFASYSKVLTFGLRNIVTVVAVPFFFVASGFIAFSKINSLETECEKNKYMVKHTKRLVLMYVIWSAIYFVFVVTNWIQKGFKGIYILEYIRDFFFEGSFSTIWFLPAVLTATLLVFFLRKKLSYKTIFLIAIPFYVFTLLGSSYYGLIDNVPVIGDIYDAYYSFFDTIKNGVCFGFIYVALGAYIAQNKDNIKIKNSHSIIAIALCWVLLAIEEFGVAYFGWNDKGVDTVIMLVPMSFFMMILAINLELPGSDKFYLMCRKYSLLMFLVQRIPLTIIDRFMGNTIISTNSIIYFVVVLAATMLLSFAIIKLSERLKALKYLY